MNLEITVEGDWGARRDFQARIPNEPEPAESSETIDLYVIENLAMDRYSFYADALVQVGHALGVSVGVQILDP